MISAPPNPKEKSGRSERKIIESRIAKKISAVRIMLVDTALSFFMA